MIDTWGHLAPIARKKYFGHIIIAVGAYNQAIIVHDNFKDLENSPWQYEDFHEFVSSQTQDLDTGIYRLNG